MSEQNIVMWWKNRRHEITPAQYATIQSAYLAMIEAEGTGESGSHYQLVLALNVAGFRGITKEEAREIAAKICG